MHGGLGTRPRLTQKSLRSGLRTGFVRQWQRLSVSRCEQALKARQLEIAKDKAAAQGSNVHEDKPMWAKLGDRTCEPEKRVGDDMPFVPVEEKIRLGTKDSPR